MFSRRARSQSPAKPYRKPLEISQPFNFKHVGGLSTTALDMTRQPGTSNMPSRSVELALRPLPSTSNTKTTALDKHSAGFKAPMPRSTSAFTFGNSMSYVSHTLGNVFKFGHRNKKSVHVPSPGNDLPRNQPLSTRSNELPRDPNMREAITGSPQLQRFFYGTQISDGQKFTRRPEVNQSATVNEHVQKPTRRAEANGRQRSTRRPGLYQSHAVDENRHKSISRPQVPLPFNENKDRQSTRRPQAYKTHAVDENGSPARFRRTMYDLGHDRDDNVRTIWEKDLRSEREEHRKSIGLASIFSDDMAEEYVIEEPTYQFAERVKPRIVHTSGAANRIPGKSQRILKTIRGGIVHRSIIGQFDENISGLRQHPNGNELAEPPNPNVSKLAETSNSRNSPHKRAQSRGQALSGIRKSHGFDNSESIGGLPIPLIKVKPASNSSKRNSTDAEFTLESPQKLRRSNNDGHNDDVQAGFKLMTALEEIHGEQHGDSGAVALEMSRADVPSQRSVLNEEKNETLAVESETDQFIESSTPPPIPPRHPGRLIPRGRHRRSSMTFAMENMQTEDHTRIPHSYRNFSTPLPSRRGELPQHGEVVPPTVAPQNTPTVLVSPPLSTSQERVLDQENAVDQGEDELQAGQDYYGIGLAE